MYSFIDASHGNSAVVFNSCCLKYGFSSRFLFLIGARSEASNLPPGPSNYVIIIIIVIHLIN